MNLFSRFAAGAMVALCALPAAFAAEPTPAPAATAPQHAARAEDVASVDSIVAALYDSISGPIGQARDFDRLRSLFMPDGRMASIGGKNGTWAPRMMSVEGYIERNQRVLVEKGFFETEVSRVTEQFGQLAHVFSTYEARLGSKESAPAMRGINSIQLYHDGSRWWIMSLVWRAEDDKLKLPERYLQKR